MSNFNYQPEGLGSSRGMNPNRPRIRPRQLPYMQSDVEPKQGNFFTGGDETPLQKRPSSPLMRSGGFVMRANSHVPGNLNHPRPPSARDFNSTPNNQYNFSIKIPKSPNLVPAPKPFRLQPRRCGNQIRCRQHNELNKPEH